MGLICSNGGSGTNSNTPSSQKCSTRNRNSSIKQIKMKIRVGTQLVEANSTDPSTYLKSLTPLRKIPSCFKGISRLLLIPDRTYSKILNFLNIKEVTRLSHVCKYMYLLGENRGLWRLLIKRDWSNHFVLKNCVPETAEQISLSFENLSIYEVLAPELRHISISINENSITQPSNIKQCHTNLKWNEFSKIHSENLVNANKLRSYSIDPSTQKQKPIHQQRQRQSSFWNRSSSKYRMTDHAILLIRVNFLLLYKKSLLKCSSNSTNKTKDFCDFKNIPKNTSLSTINKIEDDNDEKKPEPRNALSIEPAETFESCSTTPLTTTTATNCHTSTTSLSFRQNHCSKTKIQKKKTKEQTYHPKIVYCLYYLDQFERKKLYEALRKKENLVNSLKLAGLY